MSARRVGKTFIAFFFISVLFQASPAIGSVCNRCKAAKPYSCRSNCVIQADSTLAIILTSFSACYNQTANSVLVQWTVASQTNNKEFIVERSATGNCWAQAGTVQGDGTTSNSITYSFTDNNLIPGISYYRLRQIDYDGQTSTFNPVAVDVTGSKQNLIIMPNPVCSNAHLYICSSLGREVNIVITDASGRVVYTSTISICAASTNHEYSLNTATLAPGIHFLMVNNGSEVHSLKFIKE